MAQWTKVRRMNQWVIQPTTLGTSVAQVNDVREIILDPEDAVSYNARMVRVLTSYKIVLSNGTKGATNSCATLGILRAEQDLAVIAGSLSSSDSEDADMPWCFWRAWPLPLSAVETTETVFLDFGDGAYLDWQMRAGKGTNVQKDIALLWVFSVFGLQGGSVNMMLFPKILYSTP